MKKLIVIASFLLINCSAFAQIQRFNADSVDFYEQMYDFMVDARKGEGKDLMKVFELYWYGGDFSEEQRESVYETSNIMLEKEMRAFPGFRDYLNALMSFADNQEQSLESFKAWNESIQKLSGGRGRRAKRRFQNYLSISENLFLNNLMFESRATAWGASTNSYKFEFDSLPKIIFPKMNLKCFSKGDSSVIYNTEGVYYPTEEKFIGKGGKMTWERADFPENEVYAEIDDYNIDVSKSEFKIDSVKFYNNNYFDHPLLGRVHEKVLANAKGRRVSYPRFESYNKRLEIKNIDDGVHYDGGFTMTGARIIGSGSEEEDAYVTFERGDKPFILVSSKTFIIRPDKVSSEQAAISIYVKNDSIYHPGLSFRYFFEKNQLSLIRDGDGLSKTPYYNSYHELDMRFEVLSWNTNDSLMSMENLVGGTKTDAYFESSNYYSLRRYEALQRQDPAHPFIYIKKIVENTDTNVITVDQLAREMRKSPVQIEALLMTFSKTGFLLFDYDEKKAVIKDRLIDYVYNRAGKKDYDAIAFQSNVKNGSNATLSLLDFDLEINGVRSVLLSDTQQVYLYPAKRKVTVKKNRDLLFGGIVHAGRFDFFGKEFFFEYDEFKINLVSVDSLRLAAESGEKDQYGRPELVPVKTVIEKINGDLLIDKPNNKSSIKRFPNYPIFNSFRDSYVFYDKSEILGGTYDRDKFYFKVAPFTVDSLDNFNNEQLRFNGEFISAGIFPDFEETLRLQPDYSLGFMRETPPGGYPMYGGKGQFTDTIRLSHDGLRGNGTLDYLTSTTRSNDFIFYPDSMNALAQGFHIEERPQAVEYPPVNGKNVDISWHPNEDVLYAKSINNPLAMYDQKSFLTGKLNLKPEGLSGGGLFEFEKAEMTADLYDFKHHEFLSDTADFNLLDKAGGDELSFSTKNVNAHVDFEERKGVFKSNGGGSYIEFPKNQYICFMEQFTWLMDSDDIELSASKKSQKDAVTGVQLEGSKFISVHPDQDSLSFYAPSGKYDLNEKIIRCKGVQFINVADAMIYPDSGKVVIEKKAKMQTLENSRILANYVTQYHDVYESDINIYGRKNYSGSGYIDYVDEMDNKQKILLSNIGVDSTNQTYASGAITEEKDFMLSPAFEFNGDVKLRASEEFLTFDGYTRILHDCDMLSRNWIEFETQVNPNDILIPIDSTINSAGGGELASSIIMGKDSLYSAFLSPMRGGDDIDMLPAYGFLFYDKKESSYKISNKEKLNNMSFSGNFLSLGQDNCKVYGEGNINMGVDLGQISIQSAGNIIHNQMDNDVIVDLFMTTEFFMEDKALESMAEAMQESTALDPIKTDRETYEKGLREVLSKTQADEMIAEYNLYGELKKVPKELRKTMVFSDLKFKWNHDTQSYKSFGKIGVTNILKEQVNKYVKGKVEIEKKRSGDSFTMYLEISKNNWYYFSYQRGIMQTLSSSDEYNNIIKELKNDNRKMKVGRGETPYRFMLSSDRKKEDFIRNFDIGG